MIADKKLSTKGGGWLLEKPEQIFTPEDFDDTTRMIQETVRQFVEKEYRPVAEALEHGELEHNIPLLRKAGELGLLGVEVGEEYGGLDLPKTVSTVIAEALAGTGGFSVTYGVQTSIGLLPLVYWGTKEQKDKYLAKLVSGELIAAYCLTEPQSAPTPWGPRPAPSFPPMANTTS